MLCAKVIIVFVNCLKNVKKCHANLKNYSEWITKLCPKIYPRVWNKEAAEEGTPYFDVVAEKVTDFANREQLGILVRYVYQQKSVERLIEYVKCDNITGEAIANLIIELLKSNGIEISCCRSQTYDGAGNMAANQTGAALNFMKSIVLSLYLSQIKPSLNKICKSARII